MPTYFCPYCGKETEYLNVSDAAEMAQVTRTTVYSWMRKHEVHSLHRPSGRHFVCASSLVVNEEFGGGRTDPVEPVAPAAKHLRSR